MISEETLEELKCASSGQEHFVIEPIPLIKCGHCICKKCVHDNVKEIKCELCGLVSKQDFTVTQASKCIQKFLRMCIEELLQILKEETGLKLGI